MGTSTTPGGQARKSGATDPAPCDKEYSIRTLWAAPVDPPATPTPATIKAAARLEVVLKQSVAKVADQSCHVPELSSERPPIWINKASDVRHFFVVNGQAPMFLDVHDAAKSAFWRHAAKYSIRLLARDIPSDNPNCLKKGYVVSGHRVIDEGLGVFKVNFLKPGRDIGLVKRLFQFELRVGLTPAAPLDKADDAAVLVVRSHLFKVSTKPTRCMCVSTRGVEWTPRQLIDRWPALAAQPGAVVGVHNVRSRLGDVGEVAVSYSNGAVTPPWGGTSRTEVPPMKPGLAFELRFCSPTRCLNFFTDHRDRMLLEGIDLHLLPTRVWKNEFGIPEERTPPKVRRSRSGSSKRARPAAPTAAAAAAAAVATTIPASSAAASVVPSGAGAGAGARRGGIGATRVGPTSAVPPHMQLRRTNSADVVTRPAKRRSVMPAAAQRSHSSDDLRWLGLSPQAQAQEVHSVINLLAAAAELCKDGTPRKFRQSPAKPASVPGMPDFSSPSYRVAPSTSAPHSFRHHHHHQQQYPQQATGQHRQPEAGTHLGTAHIRVRETLCNTPGSALSPALPTPRASNSPDSDCSLSPRPGSVTPQKRPHRAAPLSLSGSLQRAAPLPVSVPMPIATYAPSAQRPAPSSS